MKRRLPRYRNPPPQQNLDSFLDIMTNTVGVLMFIGLFMTLVTVESANIIRTPLSRPSEKIARLYELSNDRLHYVDIPAVQDKLLDSFMMLPACEEPRQPSGTNSYSYEVYLQQLNLYQNCLFRQTDTLQRLEVDINDYTVRVISVDDLAVQYDRKTGDTVGEAAQGLRNQQSSFQQQLSDFDPQIDYIAFLVRPDSFDTFRQVRDIVQQQGFEVGWEPLKADTPIILGNQGRSIGVQ